MPKPLPHEPVRCRRVALRPKRLIGKPGQEQQQQTRPGCSGCFFRGWPVNGNRNRPVFGKSNFDQSARSFADELLNRLRMADLNSGTIDGDPASTLKLTKSRIHALPGPAYAVRHLLLS